MVSQVEALVFVVKTVKGFDKVIDSQHKAKRYAKARLAKIELDDMSSERPFLPASFMGHLHNLAS